MAKPPKKSTGKALVQWEEQLAQYATESARTEEKVGGGGGNYISTRGGRFSYQGTEMPDDTIRVIILDHVIVNSYYEGRFDPDNPSSPVCYSIGRVEEDLAPHEQSEDPQNEGCDGCPMNEYGSADTGRGKACKNGRRLAVILADDLEDIEGAEIAFLNIPPTSLKAWAGYVKQLATTLKRPPFGVITDISLEDDSKDQFHIVFSMAEKIEDAETFEAIMAKRQQAEEPLFMPFTPNSELQERQSQKPARGGRGKPARAKPAAREQRVNVKSASEAKAARAAPAGKVRKKF